MADPQSEVAAIMARLWCNGGTFSFASAANLKVLSDLGVNLELWYEDLQEPAGANPDTPGMSSSDSSDFVSNEEISEISRFSDEEYEDESDYEEYEDENEDFSNTEDWEAPPSETPSDTEDEDIPDGMECAICRVRQVTVQFASCSHATCNTCLKGIYRSRRRADDHFPWSFPCHICRAATCCVGELSQQEDFYGFAVRSVMHGDVVFTVWNWVPVRRWVAKKSRAVARGLMNREIQAWRIQRITRYVIWSEISSQTTISDDTPSVYAEGRFGTM